MSGDRALARSHEATQRQGRVVLIGVAAFHRLKDLQLLLPAPRLDFRYVVDGLAAVVRQQPQEAMGRKEEQACQGLQADWLEEAQRAMFTCLASRVGQAWPVFARGDRDSTSDSIAKGTGSRLQAAEGAPARNQERHTERAVGRRQADCRALQISEATFQWLKGVQRTTSQPRIELRFLVEGALALVQERPTLLEAVTGHARAALATHLAELAAQAHQTTSLEITP